METVLPRTVAGFPPTNPATFGQFFTIRSVNLSLAPNTGGQLLSGNSQRYGLIIGYQVSGEIVFDNVELTSPARGLLYGFVSGNIFLKYDDFGSLIGRPWFAFVSSSGATVTATEIIYTPRQCVSSPPNQDSESLAN